ncbi:MAG: hypothetical protein WBN04_14110 [Paracoccaceae bacterium]
MSEPGPVRSRRVFYIPGYDPFPPRRYRELYRKEGEDQAEMSGYELALQGRTGGENYGWTVLAEIEGARVRSEFDVLVWSDIVRDSMEAGILGTYWQMARTAWVYIASGALRHLMLLRKGPVIAALYPVGMLLLQALLAIIAAWTLGALVSRLIYPGVGWIVAIPIIVYLLRWFRKMDGSLYAYYLMHDFAFSAQNGGANPPALEERMERFRHQIAAALSGDADEVLVVGHSSGAHLAVSILADLVREGRVQRSGPRLAFLSLGQVIPMVSFLPKAHRLRADLHDLSQSSSLTWVDVTAPGDGCSFALCDPVAVTGVSPERQKWPLVISAAFTQTLSNARWRELRWRFFRLHFQYLCAFDDPGDYDYFRITAGPKTLAERFADRASSKSRIDVAASPYTSMAA